LVPLRATCSARRLVFAQIPILRKHSNLPSHSLLLLLLPGAFLWAEIVPQGLLLPLLGLNLVGVMYPEEFFPCVMLLHLVGLNLQGVVLLGLYLPGLHG